MVFYMIFWVSPDWGPWGPLGPLGDVDPPIEYLGGGQISWGVQPPIESIWFGGTSVRISGFPFKKVLPRPPPTPQVPSGRIFWGVHPRTHRNNLW